MRHSVLKREHDFQAEMCLYGDSYLSCTLISLLGSPQVPNPIFLSPCYAMSSTDLSFPATSTTHSTVAPASLRL